MLSKVYSSLIKFEQNQGDSFVTDCYQEKQCSSLSKPLNPQHPSIPKYTNAVSKLFSQITLNQQSLWIFPLNGTTTVRVYFSDPQFYPVSLCCEKCVYVEMQEDLSGSIICPNCQIILVSFIHYQNNLFNDGKISHIEKQKLFKEKKRQHLTKNKAMYDDLTSHRYKNKDLKKVLSNRANQSSLFLLTSQQCSPKNSKNGFILEMKTQLTRFNPNKNNSNKDQKLIKKVQAINLEQGVKKYPLNLKSIEQTKNIILDIFK